MGVTRKTVDNWERGISDGNFTNTYTPLDLRIKVGKAEHHAKLFLLTSGRTGTRVSQIIRSLLGANIFLKDKTKVREADCEKEDFRWLGSGVLYPLCFVCLWPSPQAVKSPASAARRCRCIVAQQGA